MLATATATFCVSEQFGGQSDSEGLFLLYTMMHSNYRVGRLKGLKC